MVISHYTERWKRTILSVFYSVRSMERVKSTGRLLFGDGLARSKSAWACSLIAVMKRYIRGATGDGLRESD